MLKKISSKLTVRNLLIINGLVVILKILYLVLVHQSILGNEDYTIAQNIVRYHRYSEFITQGGTAFKLPVYPFVMSFFIWSFGSSGLLALAIFQALSSFFVPFLLYKILGLFGQQNVGLMAGLLYLFSPAYFLSPGITEATSIFILILLIWFYHFFKIWFSSDYKIFNFILLGAITAVLFLTQVVIVPLAMMMFLALLIFKKIKLKKFAVLIVTVGILYSPWVIRNYFVFDKIVLSKTPAWQNIYYGFTPYGQLSDDLKLIPMEREYQLYSMRDEVSELKMEEIYRNEVIKATALKPKIFVQKAISNFFSLWFVPPKYFYDNSIQILFGRKIYVVILNVLTLLALVILYRKSKVLFWFSILLFGNFSFPYMIGHASNMRFKLDFEWYQLVLTAFLFSELINRSKKTAH